MFTWPRADFPTAREYGKSTDVFSFETFHHGKMKKGLEDFTLQESHLLGDCLKSCCFAVAAWAFSSDVHAPKLSHVFVALSASHLVSCWMPFGHPIALAALWQLPERFLVRPVPQSHCHIQTSGSHCFASTMHVCQVPGQVKVAIPTFVTLIGEQLPCKLQMIHWVTVGKIGVMHCWSCVYMCCVRACGVNCCNKGVFFYFFWLSCFNSSNTLQL